MSCVVMIVLYNYMARNIVVIQKTGTFSPEIVENRTSKSVPEDPVRGGMPGTIKNQPVKPITKKPGWTPEYKEGLKKVTLPRWKDAPEEDRLGEDVWLPPRLPIDDEIRTLDYGVLISGMGDKQYAIKEVVPAIRHFSETLGIPNAKERAAMRAKGDLSRGSRQGFALVASRKFLEGPLKDFLPFFDATYVVEDLPQYPFDWRDAATKFGMIKVAKVHTMSASPFDRTIMIDLDITPCSPDFGLQILNAVGDSDFALNPNILDSTPDSELPHRLKEHNSAVVFLNMKNPRTRLLMAVYVQAFHRLGGIDDPPVQKSLKLKTKDQPSLMIAMQAMSESFQPEENGGLEVPNDDVRGVIDANKLGFLRHHDFDHHRVCRPNTVSSRYCSNSPCIFVHKPWTSAESVVQFFGVGFTETGGTSLDAVFKHVQQHLGGKIPLSESQYEATSDIILGEGQMKSRALEKGHHYFQDSPWCIRLQALYRETAQILPASRYLLTTRDPDEWYDSVTYWANCKIRGDKLCGDEMMERYRKIFGANSTSKEDFTEALLMHNDAVRSFFHDELKQPDRLLEIDLTDKKYDSGVGWKILCDFFGVQEGDCPSGDLPQLLDKANE